MQMRWQHMFADNMPALHQAPAGILLSAELIRILFNNSLFYPFHRVKHTLLFVLINGCAGRYTFPHCSENRSCRMTCFWEFKLLLS